MSTILSELALEKALHVALELLKKAAHVLLKKAAEALKHQAGSLAHGCSEPLPCGTNMDSNNSTVLPKKL
nr:hypothetical protein [Tanacetum cinerariifolium]